MKKLIITSVTLILFAVASFCIYDAMFYNSWPALKELPRFKDKEIYSVDNFTDCTDYAEITYKNVSEEDLKNTESFKKTDKENLDEILNYINKYESFINKINGMDEVTDAYDFDKSVVNERDYYCMIKNSENFVTALYYFDMESQVLYYFHYCV